LNAGVAEAHRHGVLTVAHALTVDATRMAIEAGIDGLAHLFMDRPHTGEIVDRIARSGAFVVPCVVLNASMMGITGAELADPRVSRTLESAVGRAHCGMTASSRHVSLVDMGVVGGLPASGDESGCRGESVHLIGHEGRVGPTYRYRLVQGGQRIAASAVQERG
jgi:hypothetical protein